jgi:hypothetical protein
MTLLHRLRRSTVGYTLVATAAILAVAAFAPLSVHTLP